MIPPKRPRAVVPPPKPSIENVNGLGRGHTLNVNFEVYPRGSPQRDVEIALRNIRANESKTEVPSMITTTEDAIRWALNERGIDEEAFIRSLGLAPDPGPLKYQVRVFISCLGRDASTDIVDFDS